MTATVGAVDIVETPQQRIERLILEIEPRVGSPGTTWRVEVSRSSVADACAELADGGWTVICTTTMASRLDDRALKAVLAHELSHVALGHKILSTDDHFVTKVLRDRELYGFTDRRMRRALILLAQWRRFEMEADIGAVALTGDPDAAIAAVQLIVGQRLPTPDQRSVSHPGRAARIGIIERAGRHLADLNRPDLINPVLGQPPRPSHWRRIEPSANSGRSL